MQLTEIQRVNDFMFRVLNHLTPTKDESQDSSFLFVLIPKPLGQVLHSLYLVYN